MLRFGAAAALLAACLWLFDGRTIVDRLLTMELGWMLAAVAALLMQTVLMALRWRLVARCLGTEMSAAWALREYGAGQFVNATLPGGVLGDATRAVRARDGRTGLRGAATAVAIERGLGQIGLAVVAGSGLAATILLPGGFTPSLVLTAAMAAVLAVIALLLIAIMQNARGARLIRKCLPSQRVARTQAVLSIAAALLNVAAFAACARATGTLLPTGAALVLIPAILTAMLIPLTIGGWGWREGAAAALFPIVGATPAAGVAAGIAFGTAILLAVLPFAALALCYRPAGRVRPIVGEVEPKGAE
ncbi:lysylphosphatidylglycerol synthase transmembrane domain-containing protein [Jannaschia aquimarina]|uniref:lysylphosphatidylglycerol synthase transmembrane domain-containing protein n=1 Tax=Jannaschia aquimarina TaxID=935700 RepID=UPI001483C74A|nr:lysylphosphatidylglycerol synthase transmembrane domain-containing protein [Jannaschia aquimarina]